MGRHRIGSIVAVAASLGVVGALGASAIGLTVGAGEASTRAHAPGVQEPPGDAHSPALPARARTPRSPARLVWFYKPPRSAEDEAVVLDSFRTFVLSRGDEQFRSRLQKRRPAAPVLQYFLMNQIIRPAPDGVEQRNNAAYLPGDFARIWADHPDWFLRDQNGNPVVEGGKYYRMDPGSEGWRTFWIERVRAANAGWDGVFLDNLDLSLAGLQRDGFRLPAYPTDDSYTTALAGFLERIHGEVTRPEGKPLLANLVNASWGRDARAKYLDNLEGAMDEGWALGWGGGLSAASWAAHLARVDEFLARGMSAILVAQGDRWDLERQRFAYASYLLVAGPRVSFRYTGTGSYGHPWTYDNYRMPIGHALGPRYRLADGRVRRDFVNGCVVVDPRSRSASISVGACPPPQP